MNEDPCPREAEVLRARWTPELRAHLDTCDACREVEAVTHVLRQTVEAEDDESIPGASDIWWRAQWQARQDATARALRPVDTLERAEPLIALVAVATLFVMRGEVIVSRVMSWLTTDATGHALQVVMPPALLPVFIAGAGLGGLVLLVGLGAVVARD